MADGHEKALTTRAGASLTIGELFRASALETMFSGEAFGELFRASALETMFSGEASSELFRPSVRERMFSGDFR